MPEPFVKRRTPAPSGSIPDLLQMFVHEVRFYREIAPVVGVRVPDCLTAEEDGGATLLVLENLSDWHLGADPAAAARVLSRLHHRWEDAAGSRWPWLRAPEAVLDLVGDLFDATWPTVAGRRDCSPVVRSLGERLVGRVPEVERESMRAGPETLVHGDASMLNLRTSDGGEIALLDWEDVRLGPGVGDLAWLLVSSVDPIDWDMTIAAYGNGGGLRNALPSAAVQGVLSLAGQPPDSESARAWLRRLGETSRRLNNLK